jgi:hypothetical protein
MSKELIETKEINGNLYEKVPKLVKGFFKIETINANTGEVINSYEEQNKVVIWVYELFSKSVYGYTPEVPNIDDFRIHSLALGTNGMNPDGTLKDISNTQERLYSEDNFWNMNLYPENQSYVYQVTLDKPSTNDEHYAFKLNEGATYPHDGGTPKEYRGTPYNNEEGIESSVTIKRSFHNNILKQEIYMGKLVGNGHPMWDNPPKYSEAALYMTPMATPSGDYLGLMFSMKTFPEMPKTENCVIKIQWDLDFNID